MRMAVAREERQYSFQAEAFDTAVNALAAVEQVTPAGTTAEQESAAIQGTRRLPVDGDAIASIADEADTKGTPRRPKRALTMTRFRARL
jgi:hypothetical protein